MRACFEHRLTEGTVDPILITSFTGDFSRKNPLVETLLEMATPLDMLAIANHGHHYGNYPRLSPVGKLTTFGRSWFQSPRFHMLNRGIFRYKFGGEYRRLMDGFEPQSKLEDFLAHRNPADGLNRQYHGKGAAYGNFGFVSDVNMDRYAYNHSAGVMVGFESPEYVERLWWIANKRGGIRNEVAGGIGIQESRIGETIPIDDKTEVLIDYGIPGESLIDDRMKEDLRRDNIKRVRISSGYIPTGELADIVGDLSTDDDIDVRVDTNRGTKFINGPGDLFENRTAHSNFTIIPHLAGVWQARNKYEWEDHTKSKDGNKTNHLKLVVIELNDGTAIGYYGSFGGTEMSINRGTTEISIRSEDKVVIAEIENLADIELAPDYETTVV